jgi:hypothetical protein
MRLAGGSLFGRGCNCRGGITNAQKGELPLHYSAPLEGAPASDGGKGSGMCQKPEVFLDRAHENCITAGRQLDLTFNKKQHEASFNAHV